MFYSSFYAWLNVREIWRRVIQRFPKNIRSLPINCPFYRKFLTEQGIFSLLPHHRTCRLAYGGSVSYLILFQRFCSLLSNSLRLPAFCLIYVSSTLHIGFKQDIFYMRFRTVQPFPSFHLDTYGFCWLLIVRCYYVTFRICLLLHTYEISRDKPILFPRLPARSTH